jgi:hypothetical protein
MVGKHHEGEAKPEMNGATIGMAKGKTDRDGVEKRENV